MDTEPFNVLMVVILSYLLGSIPTAYLVAKSKGVDIFKVGSGNMGATNVSRSLGFGWGVFVMLVDVLKGIVAVYLSREIMGDPKAATTISAITVIIGHNWSLFATLLTGTLRGGKGAATAFGTLLVIASPPTIVVMIVIGMVIVLTTRYVSLAVLTSLFLGLLWLVILSVQQPDNWVLIYTLLLAALLLFRFKENIQRLLAGTERRLGERA